ncbi:geranylgeranyl reductase [Thiohalorhabdus denitrificans]|uniref:Protein CbrA n=1 Tax=Thiohalorhabdus denitrificans TaxID=381306 RepID=A0A0P9CWM1_9GAMM|nr:NAD(P)/FAD-dependent oxidoreductase [Thiohalorhabdus denitrificans]KPV41136.1 geranylgeranyl reductase [Thiohalorhabdus denitrificans]SCY37115.1 geranylgeranyl reductase family [Thiohalorhabdus denitrificans]
MSAPAAFDVLVVGLGPGGGSAARAAAAAGCRVLAVDRRKEVGQPVQCAEFLPNPMLRHGNLPGVLVQKITGMKTFLPSGHREDSDFPGLMIDRGNLDRAVADEAEAAGAELRLETRLLELDAEGLVARLKGPEGEYEVAARAVIGADGPHSPVAQAAGLPPQKTVHTRQHTLPLLDAYADTDIFLSPDFPGGYGWFFPKGDVANVGLGIDRRYGEDLGGPLAGLIAQLVERGLVEDRLLGRTGGSIPVGGLRPMVHPGPVLLVGDAAGLTHPITGAGIPAALISGDRAGEAAAEYLEEGDAEALEDFEEDVRDQFETSVSRGVERREELERIWGRPEASSDAPHRRGWIAFSEYFGASAEAEEAVSR